MKIHSADWNKWHKWHEIIKGDIRSTVDVWEPNNGAALQLAPFFLVARKNTDSIQQYINADSTAHKGRDTWVLMADYRQVIETHLHRFKRAILEY